MSFADRTKERNDTFVRWNEILDEKAMEKSDELYARAEKLRKQGTLVCPPQTEIYKALKLTPPDKVKVCIIGQDPYHTPGVANGLAFSTNPENPIPPSLANIFKELADDLGCPMPHTGDLTPWAKQGVLLLNTSLTVTAHQPNSHKDWGWQVFTKNIFDHCLALPQPIVFILWGANARAFADMRAIANAPKNKYVLYSPHPSPFSANRGFFGSKPFSKTNALLIAAGSRPIEWALR